MNMPLVVKEFRNLLPSISHPSGFLVYNLQAILDFRAPALGSLVIMFGSAWLLKNEIT